MRTRYSRWTGTQDPFPSGVSADSVLDELGDDLLGGVDVDRALSGLLRRGIPGRLGGLGDLRRRVEEARRRELSRVGAEGPLRDLERRLAEIRELEEQGRGDEAEALREQLRRDVAQAVFGRLANALGAMTPDDVQRMRDLLADLNSLAATQDRGEDVTEAFEEFKERYGDLLPGDPESLDELLEELARRMAAASRLAASLDAEQRAQLAALAADVLDDLDLAFQASELQHTLSRRFPELGWDQPIAGAVPAGPEDGSLARAVDWVEHLQEHDDLAAALGQDYPGARLDDIDEDAVRRLLDEEAVRDLRALRHVERVLEEAGAAHRHRGRLELTPRGIRKLGERSLARIYDRAVARAPGSHDARRAGGGGEPVGSTRPLRFGDPFRVDVGRTVHNALLRGGTPLRLEPSDFALAEAEQRVRVATVLLLDMSFSMPLRGNWVPAKKVALALHALAAGKFPEDRFYIVGFSDYARRLQPHDLLAAGWERVYGTNMQHAFLLARRLLGAHPGAEHQVLMVTDGEPTAHLEGDRPFFAWPPEPKTLRLTLAESARLARAGATLNVFLLDHDPGAARFVERMVAACGGRIFYPDLADLGRLVVRDFLGGRRG